MAFAPSRPALRLGCVVAALALVSLVPQPARAAPVFGYVSPGGSEGFEVTDDSALLIANSGIGGPLIQFIDPTAASSGWGVCYGMPAPTAPPGGGSGGTCMCPNASGTLCPATAPASAATYAAASTSLVTTHDVGDLRVTHDWHSPADPLLSHFIETTVTVQNLGTGSLSDVLYRRGLTVSYVAPPVTARTWGSIHPIADVASVLVYSHDEGRTSSLPSQAFAEKAWAAGSCAVTAGPGSASGAPAYVDVVPYDAACQPGQMFEVNLGSLTPGGSRTFRVLHGAAADESSAVTLMGLAPGGIEADFYFLLEGGSAAAAASGMPATFIEAVTGLLPPCGASCSAPPPPPPPPPPPSCTGCSSAASVDSDYDGLADAADNCPSIVNVDQADADGDGVGDACDASSTGPVVESGPRPAPAEADFPDLDFDSVADLSDNCPATPNADQADLDGDGIGDVCDADMDGDGVANAGPPTALLDDCPRVPNADQRDSDGDGVGDACSPVSAQRAIVDWPSDRPQAGTLVGDARTAAAAWAGLATAAAVGGLLLWARRRGWGLALVGLFSRLKGDAIAEHPARAQLLGLVEAQPGLSLHEIALRAGLPRTLASYHLKRLAAASLVRTRVAGRQTFYHPRESRALASDLLGPVARRVLDAIQAAPGATVNALASALAMTYGAAHYHVRQLEGAGLVRVGTTADGLVVAPAPPASPGPAAAAAPASA